MPAARSSASRVSRSSRAGGELATRILSATPNAGVMSREQPEPSGLACADSLGELGASMPTPSIGHIGSNGTVIAVHESSVTVEFVECDGLYRVEMPTDEWAALEDFADGR